MLLLDSVQNHALYCLVSLHFLFLLYAIKSQKTMRLKKRLSQQAWYLFSLVLMQIHLSCILRIYSLLIFQDSDQETAEEFICMSIDFFVRLMNFILHVVYRGSQTSLQGDTKVGFQTQCSLSLLMVLNGKYIGKNMVMIEWSRLAEFN